MNTKEAKEKMRKILNEFYEAKDEYKDRDYGATLGWRSLDSITMMLNDTLSAIISYELLRDADMLDDRVPWI